MVNMNLSHPEVLLFNYLFLAIALLILFPIVILTIECFAALLPIKLVENDRSRVFRPSVALLIPAHNEELVIGQTIETIIPQLTKQDRLIVIADNCSDRTAAIARSFGVTVIERNNLQEKGKGYALDYGVKFLESNPPEVVIVFDADCYVHSGTIEQLARQAQTLGRPVQPVNLLKRQDRSNPKSSISELAFMVKNLVRPSGLARLGLPCLVTMGTAFPWSIIHQAPLASSHLAEDMELGIDVALAGYPPIFCPSAKVTGVLPQKDCAATNQRIRWEQGHLSTLMARVPQLLKAAIVQKRLDLLTIALDLSILPLSLLLMIWAVIAVVSLILGIAAGEWGLTWLSITEGLLFFVSILSVWVKFGRKDIPLKSLAIVPFYLLWKIPIYIAFMVKPQKNWIRTERNTVDDLVLQNIRN
jgi:cellulose synthase/poly-beta-1,6-N-acetylglucosamine synthase-like glycosyltransferase